MSEFCVDQPLACETCQTHWWRLPLVVPRSSFGCLLVARLCPPVHGSLLFVATTSSIQTQPNGHLLEETFHWEEAPHLPADSAYGMTFERPARLKQCVCSPIHGTEPTRCILSPILPSGSRPHLQPEVAWPCKIAATGIPSKSSAQEVTYRRLLPQLHFGLSTPRVTGIG